MTRIVQLKDREAYRDHYIIKGFSHETWYISRDGYHISSAPSLAAARAIIDDLLEVQP